MKYLPKFVFGCFFYFCSATSVFAFDITMNEFLPNPSSPSANPEWIEFYNSGDTVVDLSDYFFDDDSDFNSDSGTSQKIALSGLLSSHATCFWNVSSYLNNNGDAPTLFKIDSTVVTTYPYTKTTIDKSYARIPDGGEWQPDQIPTKSSISCSDLAPQPTTTAIPTSTLIPPTPTNMIQPTLAASATPKSSPTHTGFPTVSANLVLPLVSMSSLSSSASVAGVRTVGNQPASPSAQVTGVQNNQPVILSLFLLGVGSGLLSGALFWKKRMRLMQKQTD